MPSHTTKVIAIIPARGGSVGIPRKNVRLLGDKPLLAYSIENCLNVKIVDEIFVSTDDDEIEEVAIRYGAKTLKRPKNLADAKTTLDEVIVFCVNQLEKEGVSASYVVTIQPTSPLIKPTTIERALDDCIRNGLDTVFSVVEDKHLRWKYSDRNELAPDYRKRLNRQELQPQYKETGGVVVCSRKTLESETRFGEQIGVIKIDKSEAIDIDDYFDWWMVEKSLQRKKICFHVVGNRSCGLGHVYRALTLADRLIDHDVSFLVNDDSSLAEQIIKERFYPVISVVPGQEIQALLAQSPDLVINDILDTEKELMASLSKAGLVSINFEDLGSGSEFADYVVNSMYESANSAKLNIFAGVKYCCLRDEFYSVDIIKPNDEVKNILLLFGGTDPANLTLKFLRWLDQIDGDWKITVILGVGNDRRDDIFSIKNKARHQIDIIQKTKIISRYMSEADIAITSAGRTVYELGSLGIPVVSVAANDREMTHDFVKNSPGVIFLGVAEKLTEERFKNVLNQLISSDILRNKLNQHLDNSDIRSGIGNVLDIIYRALDN